MTIQTILISAVLLVFSCSLYAQEARVELRSTVTGNQEQPKVLYIVPWQQAQSPTLNYQPLNSVVEGVFDEVERTEFLRELQYREKIRASLHAEP